MSEGERGGGRERRREREEEGESGGERERTRETMEEGEREGGRERRRERFVRKRLNKMKIVRYAQH